MRSNELPLREILARALRAMWPRRAHRELLLDLGERKHWTSEDEIAAIDAASTWLKEEALLPGMLPTAPTEHKPIKPDEVRKLGEQLAGSDREAGVGRWATGLAPVLGTTPKTLSNSLAGGLRSDRQDHRWLRLIARIQRGGGHPSAWSYHRRTPTAVVEELGGRVGSGEFDAGDAVLLLSLLALWQRRRPTTEARANRGRSAPRRNTPKALAAVTQTLAVPVQLRHVARAAQQLGGERGRHLLALGLEAALTEAHLEPHPARLGRTDELDTGESWIAIVDQVLGCDADLLNPEDLAVLRFRVDRMRAWRKRERQRNAPAAAVDVPYVRASTALERAYAGLLPEAESFEPSEPGIMMLWPMLRSRDFGG